MLFPRLLGQTLLFIAFMALVYDGVRIVANPNQGLSLATLSMYLKAYSPDGRDALVNFFLGHGLAFVWTGVVQPLLGFPVSIFLGALGALLFLSGYRRPPPEFLGD